MSFECARISSLTSKTSLESGTTSHFSLFDRTGERLLEHSKTIGKEDSDVVLVYPVVNNTKYAAPQAFPVSVPIVLLYTPLCIHSVIVSIHDTNQSIRIWDDGVCVDTIPLPPYIQEKFYATPVVDGDVFHTPPSRGAFGSCAFVGSSRRCIIHLSFPPASSRYAPTFNDYEIPEDVPGSIMFVEVTEFIIVACMDSSPLMIVIDTQTNKIHRVPISGDSPLPQRVVAMDTISSYRIIFLLDHSSTPFILRCIGDRVITTPVTSIRGGVPKNISLTRVCFVNASFCPITAAPLGNQREFIVLSGDRWVLAGQLYVDVGSNKQVPLHLYDRDVQHNTSSSSAASSTGKKTTTDDDEIVFECSQAISAGGGLDKGKVISAMVSINAAELRIVTEKEVRCFKLQPIK